MTTRNPVRLVNWFAAITFIISTCFVSLIYFSPTQALVDYSVLYGAIFLAFTVVLLGLIITKILQRRDNRRRLVKASAILIANLIIAIGYYFVWDYSIGTILVKVANKTGQDVTDAGIYGCYPQSWGTLKSGETRTVRFPGNVGCVFIVTYKVNGVVKYEAFPRKYFTTNHYELGTNSNMEIDN